MPDFRRGFSDTYSYSSDYNIRVRRTAQNYQNYGYFDGGGIEFRTITEGEDESGPPSPTLWETSPTRVPEAEASLLHHNSLSPTSRRLAIAKGRKEIMDMIRNIPESSYELSLQDLVEKPCVETSADNKTSEAKVQSEKRPKRKKGQETKQRRIGRSVSLETPEHVMLKMFFPSSLGLKKKKKSLSMGTESKIPPRSPELETKRKEVDKEWWKKRYSFAGDSDVGVINRNNNGSTGSSGSSSSGGSRRRSKIGRFAHCWSCFQPKDKTL